AEYAIFFPEPVAVVGHVPEVNPPWRTAGMKKKAPEEGMSNQKRSMRRMRLPVNFVVVSWRDLAVIVLPVLLFISFAVWFAFRFVRPAPLDTIVIASGPDGSTFRTTADKYRKIIERNGVKVQILTSQGGLDNLHKLADPSIR